MISSLLALIILLKRSHHVGQGNNHVAGIEHANRAFKSKARANGDVRSPNFVKSHVEEDGGWEEYYREELHEYTSRSLGDYVPEKSAQVLFSNSTSPKKVNGTRIAVCISGQLRSGNLTWNSGHIHQNAGARMFGDGDPPTPISTIIEFMFIPLVKDNPTIEGLDVFMYVTAHPDQPNSTYWDGDPWTFEPSPGDTTVCTPFSNHPFFHKTGNKIFCLVEAEKQLLSPILENNLHIWQSYTYRYTRGAKEQVLQQYYGMYRANLMAKQYALYADVVYSHKLRVRPDTAVVKPFPLLSAMDFKPTPTCPNGQIWYANKVIYKSGNEDWFNIGTTETMDHLLDRYIDFTTLPHVANWRGKDHWDLEDNLIGVMERYGVCMNWYYDIWMVVIRRQNHAFNSWLPPVVINNWKELST